MNQAKRQVAVVTGSRAEFGLLRPLMKAIESHPELELSVIVAGSHLLPPQYTVNEVQCEFALSARIVMQKEDHHTRDHDAAACGRGILAFAEHFALNRPDCVLVLGDRIEAFAAATAAALAGIRVAHVHGGDRAEGVADESMRHAISKLAHLHFPATQESANRLMAMGEDAKLIHIVGSPSIDGINDIKPLCDEEWNALGKPKIVVLLHPVGDDESIEFERASMLYRAACTAGSTLILHPNHDAGRGGIVRAIGESTCQNAAHLDRSTFVGLLRRAHLLIGNSSAGLIEAAAIPIRAINIGNRQAGRERPEHVIDVPQWDYQTIHAAIKDALAQPRLNKGDISHPFGDGNAGKRIADILASFDLIVCGIRKRNTY